MPGNRESSRNSLNAETIRFLESLFTKIDKLFAKIDRKLARLTTVVASVETKVSKVDDKITAFAAAANNALTKANTALDNIQADEANLAQKIAELQLQIANDPNSDLSPDSQAALDSVMSLANTVATRTQAAADSVPDSVPPPPVE